MNTIKYLSGGLLGDFIHQLSIIKEKYLETGKKGDLYLIDKFTPEITPVNFPEDWRHQPWYNINWRNGIENTYNEIKDVVLQQEYINSFQIYNGGEYDIHLSSWRSSDLLYKSSMYDIFKKEYGVEWGSHKWLNLPIDEKYNDCILISTSKERYNYFFDFGFLMKFNKKIYYISNNIEEYDFFKYNSNFECDLILIQNLAEFWIALNSCYLFVGNLSSHLALSNSLHKKTLALLPNLRDDIHLSLNLPGLTWYRTVEENNLKFMEHFYEKIDGWFDFQSVYTEMVEKFDSGSHFVEVGVMFGKSTAYLATEILNSGKDIKLDCIDIWEVYQENGVIGNAKTCYYDGMEILVYDKFLDNVKPVKHLVNPIKGESTDMSKLYDDGSLDFVFIDANHEYESILNDIKHWYPKIKPNGVIGGHDYDWPEVEKAVIEFFGKENVKTDNRSWVVYNEKKSNKKLSICVSTMCYNEVEIMPFFIDYYVNYVGADKILFYDGGSNDGTLELIKQCEIGELILEENEKSDTRWAVPVWNEKWKRYRNDYDWMIICDMDEFLYHPKLKEKLKEYKENGITIPLIEGFDMISMEYPIYEKGNYLPNIIKRGIKDPEYLNKNLIFNPKEVDINYRMGCHKCDPTGNVKWSEKDEMKLLHYKWLSYDTLTENSRKKYERLSDWNLEHRAGEHYNTYSKFLYQDYVNRYEHSTNIVDNEKFNIDLDIHLNDLESIKIKQLDLLEYFMKNEHNVPYSQIFENNKINYYKFITINNTSEQNLIYGNLLFPYMLDNNYKIIEKSNKYVFLKNEKKGIYIFSHNYLINNWKDILSQQLDKIKKSGLYKNSTRIFLCGFGEDTEWKIFENTIKIYDSDNKIEIIRHSDNYYEYRTLQFLWNYSQKLSNGSNLLYFHLKGVWSCHNLQTGNNDEFDSTKSIKNPEALLEWRKCMEYFNIERWYNAIDRLDEGYDVVGALYNYNPECPLFTGNFWWANSEYIKKLEYPEFIKEKEPYDVNLWVRIKCEKWINSIKNNYFNLYVPKDLDLYHVVIKPEEYRDDINPLISVLTSSYKKYDELKNAIDSVINQTYINWEMLICSDGYDEMTKNIIEKYQNEKIKYYHTDRTNDYGSTQKIYLTEISKGKYIIYLDDDNIIYPNYLETIVDNFDDSTGMIISHIDYDGLDTTLPVEDKIVLGKIDTLCLCVDKCYTKHAIWKNYAGQDYEFIKICENNILNHNKNVKFIPNVLGKHIDRTKLPKKKNVIFHHNYLRFNWLNVLIDQIYEMKNSGLYEECDKIIATIYSEPNDDVNRKMFKDFIKKEDHSNKWTIIDLYKNDFEYDILKTIKKYCDYINENINICYFHLKGVCSEQLDEPNIGIPYWRKYLIYFTITKWKENIEKLKEFDIIGLDYEFNQMHQRNVLGGHFFWTKSEYIKTLEEPIVTNNRYLPEIWITSNEQCKVYSNFYCSKAGITNCYLQPIYESLYRDDMNISKRVIVMTAHPNFKTSEEITKQSLESFKPLKIDTILSTHCPVSEDLQRVATHVVYDKNNPLIRHDYYDKSWFDKEDYYALIKLHKNDNDFQHALAVYINYYNGILKAKNMGYKTAICTNFDIVFHEEDLKIFEDRINTMNRLQKKSFFLTSKATEGLHYKTIFFITDVDFFLENFKYVTNEEEYNKLTREVGSETNCLENYFYQTLKNSDKIILQEISENDLFSKSRVNLFSNIEYFTTLPLRNNKDYFVIWFSSSNSFDDNRELKITVMKDVETIFEKTDLITKNYIFFEKIKYERDHKYVISQQIKYNDLIKEKQIVIDNDSFDRLSENGEFWDKISEKFDIEYEKETNKIHISSGIDIDARVSIMDKDKNVIYSTISNFRKNKFWYMTSVNLNDLEEVLVEIEKDNGDIVLHKKIKTKDVDIKMEMNILNNLVVYEPKNKKERIGRDMDGGYVIVDGYEYDQFIGAGVGGGGNTSEEISFEINLIKKYPNLRGYIFDGTINNSPNNLPNNIIYIKKNIGPISNDSFTNIKEYVKDFNNIFIKMDIDGSEWDWILSFKDHFSKVKQIVFEAHGILNNKGYIGVDNEKIFNSFQILNESHYLVHVHSNNCSNIFTKIGDNNYPSVLELTYIRKDCGVLGFNTKNFPCEFDFPCWPNTMEHDLNFWPFRY